MQDTIENFFTVDNLNIIMPTLLVICAFGLKIFRKYPPDPIDFVSTFIELPMDIIILALGYISCLTRYAVRAWAVSAQTTRRQSRS